MGVSTDVYWYEKKNVCGDSGRSDSGGSVIDTSGIDQQLIDTERGVDRTLIDTSGVDQTPIDTERVDRTLIDTVFGVVSSGRLPSGLRARNPPTGDSISSIGRSLITDRYLVAVRVL